MDLPLRRRALLVISDLEFGGAQRQAVLLANSMDPERFEMHVCSLDDYVPLAVELQDRQNRFHLLQKRCKYDFSLVMRLARLLRRIRAHVVHAFLFDAQISARLAARLVPATAVIGSERNSDYSFKKRHLFAQFLTRKWVDLVIANSNAGAEFSSRVFYVPRDRYRVIHNGVDTDRFHPRDGVAIRAELGIGPQESVIGMFASFKAQKNHPLLLHAARQIIAQIPDTRLLFVGDEVHNHADEGERYKDRVLRLATELGLLKRCVFTGRRHDVERLYPACDLTVLPSLFEGTPNVLLESMASAVPVVATNVADNAYLVPDGVGGFLVPADDAQSLQDRIRQLLTNPTLRREMGHRAQSWVTREFSPVRLAAKTGGVYEEAIQLRNKARTRQPPSVRSKQ